MQPWLKADVLFLLLSLNSGMPMTEVAGFLGRDEKEVQQKVEELHHSANSIAL
jgi:predicted transcriptional regulator